MRSDGHTRHQADELDLLREDIHLDMRLAESQAPDSDFGCHRSSLPTLSDFHRRDYLRQYLDALQRRPPQRPWRPWRRTAEPPPHAFSMTSTELARLTRKLELP